MKMEVRANQHRVGANLRHHVEKRLRFALGRFSRQVNTVKVQLSDLNGPRGGVDQCCRVEVSLVSGGRLIVEDTQSYLYAAISRAAERVGRALARQLSRQRDAQRIPIPIHHEA
ncbi:MAG: HPF/RaiA family ribosome-associated protein [Candidatus Latescibacteria bacterium]|nr:HPF/RaiA family ribosome-associated protein [Candidatus Latescibacterota bacterium]